MEKDCGLVSPALGRSRVLSFARSRINHGLRRAEE
jgi:hypothetical protein